MTKQGVDIFVIMNKQKLKRIMSITFDTGPRLIVVFQTDEPGCRCHEEEVAEFSNILQQNVNKVKKKIKFLFLGDFNAKRSLKSFSHSA